MTVASRVHDKVTRSAKFSEQELIVSIPRSPPSGRTRRPIMAGELQGYIVSARVLTIEVQLLANAIVVTYQHQRASPLPIKRPSESWKPFGALQSRKTLPPQLACGGGRASLLLLGVGYAAITLNMSRLMEAPCLLTIFQRKWPHSWTIDIFEGYRIKNVGPWL